jgi:hypothetical protein
VVLKPKPDPTTDDPDAPDLLRPKSGSHSDISGYVRVESGVKRRPSARRRLPSDPSEESGRFPDRTKERVVTGFRGTNDAGGVADPLTPESLRPLLWEATDWVLVERVADGPASGARARRVPGGRWSIEVRPESTAALTAEVPNTDAAFDALRSWAADDGWWLEAFGWRRV